MDSDQPMSLQRSPGRSSRSATLKFVLLAVAVIATSCSGGSLDSFTGTTTTSVPVSTVAPTTAAPTTTIAPATTSTASPTTTTTTTTTTTLPATTSTALACGGSGGLPTGAENHTLAAADVDGDGADDTIHTYTLGDPLAGGGWWIQVSFASGGGASMQLLDSAIEFSGSIAIDGYDINGDGRDEFFAKVGAGASSQLIAVFDVPGCTIRRPSLNGFDAVFIISGGINFTSGITCTDVDSNGFNDFLTTRDGERIGATNDFTVDVTDYSYVAGQFSVVGTSTEIISAADPAFVNYGRLTCGPVVWS